MSNITNDVDDDMYFRLMAASVDFPVTQRSKSITHTALLGLKNCVTCRKFMVMSRCNYVFPFTSGLTTNNILRPDFKKMHTCANGQTFGSVCSTLPLPFYATDKISAQCTAYTCIAT